MNTHQPSEEPEIRRIDRVLAISAITLIGLAVLCFIAIIVGTQLGADFGTPLWTAVSLLVQWGLPLGIVMFFALIIMNMMRRSRAARAADPGRKR